MQCRKMGLTSLHNFYGSSNIWTFAVLCLLFERFLSLHSCLCFKYDPVTWYKITHAGEQLAVRLPKQSNSYQLTLACLCFGSPTVQLAHQHVWFCTMWPDRAKGLLQIPRREEPRYERKGKFALKDWKRKRKLFNVVIAWFKLQLWIWLVDLNKTLNVIGLLNCPITTWQVN